VGGEELVGADQEPGTGIGALIGVNVWIGETAVVVHRGVHVVVADTDTVDAGVRPSVRQPPPGGI
jgi:arginase family enzyme